MDFVYIIVCYSTDHGQSGSEIAKRYKHFFICLTTGENITFWSVSLDLLENWYIDRANFSN